VPVLRPEGWCVYLLRCGDGTLYCGVTNDLAARLAAHRAGKGARYTRGRGPLRLVWCEAAEGKGPALSREYAVKQLSTAGKRALIRAAGKARRE
jgi:putative endonuclease